MSSPGPLPEHLDEALALLLDRAHTLHPDELGEVVADVVGVLEATEVEVYIADPDPVVLEAQLEPDDEPLAETVRRLSKAIVNHQGASLTDDATLLMVHWHRIDRPVI